MTVSDLPPGDQAGMCQCCGKHDYVSDPDDVPPLADRYELRIIRGGGS